jgi:molybdopterin/thiamine biosynthesis adenylyltransferase/rhodanese-related sulfurtransferase
VVAHRLAARKPAHERAETRERGREVVLVEAADGGRNLCLVTGRMQPRGPRVEPLGRVLMARALEDHPAKEQRIGARRLEQRIETVLRNEELRMEELVRPHLVERVAARLLGGSERLLGLVQEPGAEERDAVVELDDRVFRGRLGDGFERLSGGVRRCGHEARDGSPLGRSDTRYEQRVRQARALHLRLRRALTGRKHDAGDRAGGRHRYQPHDQADSTGRRHGSKLAGMRAVVATVWIAMTTYRELLQQTRAEIREIDARAAQNLDGAQWIDVRESDEWQEGHLPGAVHVPRGHLESRIEGVTANKSQPVILYCAAGNRSVFAAKTLEELGYETVYSLAGGFTDWKRNGLEITMPRTLSPEKRTRYSRHLLIPEIGEEGQLKLLDSRILLIGAGGLGSPAALYLAAAGIGRLGIIDADIVDETNLQRQIAHSLDTLGTPKVDSAKRAIEGLNPDVDVVTYRERLTSENIDRILDDGWDVIVDGADNFPTRYLVNDASVWRGIPVVHGSIYRFEGQVTVFKPHEGPCYRCLFPEPPPPELAPSCAEGGVLGVLPGIVGTLQTNEAIKLAAGIGEPLIGRLLLLDALAAEFTEVKIERRDDCPVCGTHPTITEYIDYVEFCSR